MTRRQIDKLCLCIIDDDVAGIAEFINDNELKEKLLNSIDEYEEMDNLDNAICKNLMPQIEKEGYEYFYTKIPSNPELVILLTGMEDKERLKDCIKDETLGLDNFKKVNLVIATGDKKYIGEYVKSEMHRLEDFNRVRLIKATGDKEYIKKCINDETLELNISYKLYLVKATGDKEYIKKCINDETLELNIFDKLDLIILTGDKEYIREYVKGIEKSEEIKAYLILNNVEFTNSLHINQNFNFNLPKEMTIGMEIESEGKLSSEIIRQFNFYNWYRKNDRSLGGGVEVISPILHPTQEEAKQIYIVCDALSKLGQNISDRCGGHIHIGADYLTSKQAYINFMEIWCNTEKILYGVCNEENTAPRSGITKYARPIASKVQEGLERGTMNFDEEELDKFVIELKYIQEKKRDSGLNLLNINTGKNTIEFRLANGTLNPDLWMDNINLFGGIVAVSEELARIQERGIEIDEDRTKLNMIERLKEDISEEKKLEVLLGLIGLEPEVYKARYNSNIKLINNDLKMEKAFSGVKGPISIKPKKPQIQVAAIAEVTEDVPASEQQRAMEELMATKGKSKEETVHR